uniref:Uncharacterized protein n=1 Tax=Bursaphelenchus xylophilus TaxID=6326 RepID=A0A1I7SP89_BURXY
MSKLALFVLLAAVAVVSARDKAHITGKFYCSARSQHQWIPSSTHLKFWDKGRIFDNIVNSRFASAAEILNYLCRRESTLNAESGQRKTLFWP